MKTYIQLLGEMAEVYEGKRDAAELPRIRAQSDAQWKREHGGSGDNLRAKVRHVIASNGSYDAEELERMVDEVFRIKAAVFGVVS